MLRSGVAACLGMVLCVRTVCCVEHSTQYARIVPFLDMLAHHRIAYTDVIFYSILT
jgi:hypothetical protein